MKGTHVWFLVQEDPTCRGMAEPGRQTVEPLLWSLGTTTPEPLWHSYWSPWALEPVLWNKRSHPNEKSAQHNYESSSCSPWQEKSPQSNKDSAQPKTNKTKKTGEGNGNWRAADNRVTWLSMCTRVEGSNKLVELKKKRTTTTKNPKKDTQRERKKHIWPAVCITRLNWIQPSFCVHPAKEQRQTNFKRHGSPKLGKNALEGLLLFVCLVIKLCPTPCDPWTVDHPVPLYKGFARQECWSGLPLHVYILTGKLNCFSSVKIHLTSDLKIHLTSDLSIKNILI